MEAVKNWAFSVCCASVFCGILNMILPEGSTQKIFKAVIYVFFLCVVISTFSGFDFSDLWFASGEKDKDYLSGSENEFNEISEEFIEDEIICAVKEIFTYEGIEPKDISLKVNISGEGSIDIIDFTVVLEKAENPDELSEKIFKKTGIEPKIIVSGEN